MFARWRFAFLGLALIGCELPPLPCPKVAPVPYTPPAQPLGYEEEVTALRVDSDPPACFAAQRMAIVGRAAEAVVLQTRCSEQHAALAEAARRERDATPVDPAKVCSAARAMMAMGRTLDAERLAKQCRAAGGTP